MYSYTAGPEGCEIMEIRHDGANYGTYFPENTPAQWAKYQETARANGPLWQSMTAPPTLAPHRRETNPGSPSPSR